MGDSPDERGPLKEVLRRFVQLGGKVVDTSPIYGRAESVVGDLTGELNLRDSLFLATKVWTTGKQAGIDEMERSLARLRTKRLDLIQVHNLVDLDTQLATLRAWKEEGRIRYLGITHYNESSFPRSGENPAAREARLPPDQLLNRRARCGENDLAAGSGEERSCVDLTDPLSGAISSRVCARNRSRSGRRNSIANHGRNFFSSGFWGMPR